MRVGHSGDVLCTSTASLHRPNDRVSSRQRRASKRRERVDVARLRDEVCESGDGKLDSANRIDATAGTVDVGEANVGLRDVSPEAPELAPEVLTDLALLGCVEARARDVDAKWRGGNRGRAGASLLRARRVTTEAATPAPMASPLARGRFCLRCILVVILTRHGVNLQQSSRRHAVDARRDRMAHARRREGTTPIS